MIKKLLAIVLLLHIGLCFAQNSVKLPASPFSFQNGNTTVNNINSLPNAGLPDININLDNTMPVLPANINNSVNTETDTIIGDTKKYLNNLTEKILEPLTGKLYKYGEIIRKASLKLFLYLFGFAILWRFIKFLMRGEYDLKLWLLDTVLMIIFMQLALYFIKNANVINLQIINWFRAIAEEATGISKITPSLIIDLGIDYFIAQTKFIINMSFNDFLKGILLMGISGLTAITLIIMVTLYIKAIIESIIVAQFSVIFLAFWGLEQTRDMGTRPIFQWINIGIKLMFLQMMLGLEYDLLKDFIHMEEINIASAISVLFVSIFMLIITWEIPSIFERIIMGSVGINNVSQQAASSLAKFVAGMATGGVAGSIAKGAVNAGMGVAQNIGGVQRAMQAYDNYKSSQVSSGSSINGANSFNSSSNSMSSANNPISNKDSGFNSSTSNSSNNSSSMNKILSPIGTKTTGTNTATNANNSASSNSSNNSYQYSGSSNASNSSLNQIKTQSQSSSNNNSGKIKGLATGVKDMIKDNYNSKVDKTAGGRLAQHFDNKAKANNAITDKAKIDEYYKNMWSTPEQKNVNTILENHSENNQDKESK